MTYSDSLILAQKHEVSDKHCKSNKGYARFFSCSGLPEKTIVGIIKELSMVQVTQKTLLT